MVNLRVFTTVGFFATTLLLQSAVFAKTTTPIVETIPGEFIVKMKKDGKGKSHLFSQKGLMQMRSVNVSFGDFYVARFDIKNMKQIKNLLATDPGVEYYEPNFVYRAGEVIKEKTPNMLMGNENSAPNDPLFSKQWGLRNTGTNDPKGEVGKAGADVKMLEAWNLHEGSKDIKVAVIDTGIDYNHPELASQMWTNTVELNGKTGVDDDGNGYIDDIHGYNFSSNTGNPLDDHGHGTHCAGVIGAVSDNSVGIAGMLKDVTLVGVKFLSKEGSGSTEGAIQAIDYATKIGVDVMSNSWGGGGYSKALEDSIKAAGDKGIVFVAAAGNSGANSDNDPEYPASYNLENVIAVGASTAADSLAGFSNYSRKRVHIAAPGKSILSTVLGTGYEAWSGTSMATPHVSGAVGLLIAQDGHLPFKEISRSITNSGDRVKALKGKIMGASRLNVYHLLAHVTTKEIEPNESEWRELNVEPFESTHPYASNESISKTYTVAGAKYLRARIAKFDLEKGYDVLEASDAKGVIEDRVSGVGTQFVTNFVEGDTLTLTFKADNSVHKWGFVVQSIDVVR